MEGIFIYQDKYAAGILMKYISQLVVKWKTILKWLLWKIWWEAIKESNWKSHLPLMFVIKLFILNLQIEFKDTCKLQLIIVKLKFKINYLATQKVTG